jgi:hypothetical protein
MSANEDLINAAVRHGLGLEKFKRATVRTIIALLNDADRELTDELAARLAIIETKGFDPGPYTTKRLEAMIAALREKNAEAHAAAGKLLRKELKAAAAYEIDYQSELLDRVTPVQVSWVRPDNRLLGAIVDSQPFHGAILGRWTEDLAADKLRKIERVVNVGIASGQKAADIVRKVAGTKAQRYADGILEISRRDAETWILSAASHTARDELFVANADIVQAVRQVSTLDLRTTPQCFSRDGKRWSIPDYRPLDHAIPWGAGPGRLHGRCRSTSTAELRAASELGLPLKEGATGTRASMDGQVPAPETGHEWIERQAQDPKKRVAVETYLGPTRFKLMTEGKLSFQDMVRNDGDLWTLDVLRERENEAFARAGLKAA